MTEEIDEDTIEMLGYPLKHYIRGVFRDVMDFRAMVLNREQVDTDIWEYDAPGQYIYLDSDGYAVTYGKQKVADNKVYYRFTDDETLDEDLAYEYIAEYEWTRNWEIPEEEEEEES